MGIDPRRQRLILDDTAYDTLYTRKFARRRPWVPPDPSTVRAYIPGVIAAVHVREGSRVARGERLLVLEAMKMQNDVLSPREGVVAGLEVKAGDRVEKGQVLLRFE